MLSGLHLTACLLEPVSQRVLIGLSLEIFKTKKPKNLSSYQVKITKENCTLRIFSDKYEYNLQVPTVQVNKRKKLFRSTSNRRNGPNAYNLYSNGSEMLFESTHVLRMDSARSTQSTSWK